MFWLRNCTRIKTLFHLSTELMSTISSFVTPLPPRSPLEWDYVTLLSSMWDEKFEAKGGKTNYENFCA